MSESFYLYRWAVLAAMIAAPALALVGAQLMARGWTTRALIVSQGSSTGLILGLSALSVLGVSSSVAVFGGALTAAIALSTTIGTVLFLMDRNEIRNAVTGDPRANAVLFSIYALLLSVSSLVTAYSPHLEINMTTSFIGDISTVTDLESRLSLAGALAIAGWIWLQWNELTRDAFNHVVLGERVRGNRAWMFAFLTAITISVAMQSMGFLFVLGSLFIPTSLLGHGQSGLRRFRFEITAVATLGALLGFFLSLQIGSLPTAPAIVVSQALCALLFRFCTRKTALS